MIDITTNIRPLEREHGIIIKKWAGSITLKGGEDESILHWHIERESPRLIVKSQICVLESMKDAIEKRIKLLESSIRKEKEYI